MIYRGNPGRGRGRAAGSGGGGGSYWINPDLDLDLIPFHTATGAWGTQLPVVAPQAPTTNTTGTAGTVTQLRDALYTPNLEVTLTAVIDGMTANAQPINNVDVICPPGTGIYRANIGSASGTQSVDYLRIRGSTIGAHSGGLLHNVAIFPPGSNVIIEGCDASGPGGNNGALRFPDVAGFNIDGVAINKIRANCGGYFLLCNASNVIETACSVITAQDTASPVEAWGNRWSRGCLGYAIEFGNDIRASTARAGGSNNVYHRTRRHPNPGSRYSWIYNNTFIDRVQSRILLIDAAFGQGTGTLDAAWFLQNLIIATYASGANGRDLNITDALYARVNGNDFQSDQFTSSAQIILGAPVVDGDKTGNTFGSLPGSDPGWKTGTPGDPSSVPWLGV